MKHYDVIIIGAGAAGVCAALAAGRAGASCALIEKNGIPGGTITSCGIAAPGLFAVKGKQIISGIGWELVKETLAECGKPEPDLSCWQEVFWHNQILINPLIFAAVCDRNLLAAKVDIHYHTMLGKLTNDRDLWHVTLCGKEGLFDVTAEIVLDCTGDANAASIAGYETLQPDTCQPGTYSAALSGTGDITRADLFKEAFEKELAKGTIRPEDVGWSPGYSNLFLQRNGINANHVCGINACTSEKRTEAEIAGRASLLRTYKFFKKQPGFEKLDIHPVSFECGIRESRVIRGEYTVTDEDYASGRRFEDAVCYAWYPMDLHEDHSINAREISTDILPTVPRRALIPLNSSRFAAAGRIISSTRGANAGFRVQAVCMATGEVCGTMAHTAVSMKKDMRDIPLDLLPFSGMMK